MIFAPNPVSVLWSHLCRSSSVTRSTAMKKTCRKSLQPSKVSQGCRPNSPQRAGCSLSPWHTGLLAPTGLGCSSDSPRMPHFPSGFETEVPPKSQEQALSPSCVPVDLLPACSGPAPLSRGCTVWLRLALILPFQALCTPRAPAYNLPFVSSPCISPTLVEPLRSPCGE